MLASFLISLLALPLAALALPHRRWEDDRAATIWARADVRSTEASGLNISARFEFEGYFDGSPTFVKVKVLSGLTRQFTNHDTQLPISSFNYHIHTNPITNNSFATALAHLDSLDLTEGYICNPAFPSYCQNGDLSGKHGALNGTDDGAIPAFAYSDAYVRFWPQDFSILGRSIVIHGFNKTRIAAGNIISPYDSTADLYWNPTGKPSTYNSPSSLPIVAPIQPTPAIVFSNGTSPVPSREYLDSLPYRFPYPLIPLSEALNVNIKKVRNTKGVEVLANIPSTEKIPFKGSQLGTWGWTW